MFRRTRSVIWVIAIIWITILGVVQPGAIPVLAQQPTGSVPTVTGTPPGPTIKVDQSLPTVNVFAGPGSFDYPAIGVLLGNETAPAIGRARGREDWILIRYPGVPGSIGWVWGLQVSLSPGALLPIVDVPPTPTRRLRRHSLANRQSLVCQLSHPLRRLTFHHLLVQLQIRLQICRWVF